MITIDKFIGEYRWLSNFWPSVVVLDGKEYPTVEHAYQAAKTLDDVEREFIRRCNRPGAAKRLGKLVTLREDWDQVKIKIMMDLLVQKFRHKELADKLIATGGATLIEGNTWNDTFWGVCDGVGDNNLGKILTIIRASLQGFTFEGI
jgi:ribA/ribD-fused uncharacterized protein